MLFLGYFNPILKTFYNLMNRALNDQVGQLLPILLLGLSLLNYFVKALIVTFLGQFFHSFLHHDGK